VRLGSSFLGSADVRVSDGSFLALFTRAVTSIPSETPPLRSVRRVSLKRRGGRPGLVGLTKWGELSYGRTTEEGIQFITFYTDLLSQLSEKASIGVIAHELAHAWLNEHVYPEDSQVREREADELARRWGFEKELDALDLETEPL